MGQPYVGEIRMFAGSFAPAGWAFCSGQLMPISENETLFQLIGTTYGGDGEETFALPALASRVPIHQGTRSGDGQTFVLGEMAGVESVTLTTNQIPQHNHAFLGTTNFAAATTAQNNLLAQGTSAKVFTGLPPTVSLAANAITAAGGSQPHENLQPYLCVSFIISLFGVFPSQN